MKAEKVLKLIIVMTSLSLALSGCKADLIVDELTHSPESPTTKDKITFTAVVKNIGYKKAEASTLGLKVGGETHPAEYPIPPLKPGRTHSIKRKERLSVAQRYRNTATADLNADVDERNERNNKKTEDYTVRSP
jgi:subtilase family serine protease